MASYIKKIKLGTTIYEVRDSSAVHSGDTNANISITGSAESANTANSATTAETADVATKLGTTVVGGSNQPIYLNNGVPTAIGYTIADNVPSGAKFTDTVYTHPTYESRANGLYKITVDGIGHVSEAVAVTKDDIATLAFKPTGNSYLTFSSPNSFTLAVGDSTKHWDGTLEYFASDKTWTVWDGTTTLSAVDNDEEYVLYLRGTGNTVITGAGSSYNWVLTGTDISCIGNIENLLDYATVKSGVHPTMATNCYRSMFRDCTSLTQAPALPVTTLANFCYQYMFQGCTSLTQAPALPATTLADFCYDSMFQGCTSLIQAPALPATTLADFCYDSMFQGCTSLIQAPALPATTLVTNCYDSMFQGCTSLTQAPALPATTLATNCYRSMFQGCTSLIQVPVLPATMLANYCYDSMFQGCTSLTQVPALPATTLADYCYGSMFQGCTSLTQVPALPATMLANSCYENIFYKCSKIKLSDTNTGEYTQEYRIPSSGTGTTENYALSYMFFGTGGTFTGTPAINTTYYLSSDNMIVRETEIATLNGYVGAVIDTSVDSALSSTSTNPVQNKVINTKLDSMQSDIDSKVPSSRTVNGKALTTNITLSASDVGALPNTTQIPSIDGLATETYVDNKVAGLVGSIPVVVVSSSQPSGQKSGDLWYKIV